MNCVRGKWYRQEVFFTIVSDLAFAISQNPDSLIFIDLFYMCIPIPMPERCFYLVGVPMPVGVPYRTGQVV
jgi:hypothetical protein